MIAKDSTVAVNFLVLDTDGFPATGQASNINAAIYINGTLSDTVSSGISQIDARNLPGWYKFNYTFNSVGNVFVKFVATNNSNLSISPWEDNVIIIPENELKALQSAILHWAVSGNTLYLYNSDNTTLGTYTLTRDSSGNIIQMQPTN